ncbi:MAG: polymerase ECF-subfamily sigma factor [Thermoleophilia bacterium]|nr:polymerase ECF-subfamily sigma factor [Thermoleophilia bacterium]
MDQQTITEPELHREKSRGDDAWLRALVREHLAVLRRIAVAQVGPDEADDVLSEAFAVAWRERATYDSTIAGERAWLAGIVWNRCRSMGRARRRWVRRVERGGYEAADGTEEFDDASVVRLDAERLAPRLLRALHALPDDQQTVLLLVAIGDLEPSSVAALIDVPAATVRSWLLRARRTIADQFEDEGVCDER